MEIDRAQAIADVAKVVVESPKVEVAFLKVTGAAVGTDFLPDGAEDRRRLPPASVRRKVS